MIGKTYGGVDAGVDLTINGVAVNYRSIVNLEFEVGESLHDYAVVEMAGIPVRAVTDYVGKHVRFFIRSGPKFVHQFYGTIEDVRPIHVTSDGVINGSPFQQCRLHCFGTSYRMRGKKSKVWEATSLLEMAEKMADTYGFSLASPNPPRVRPRYMQHAESDWTAITNYAGMHGLKVNVHGTHMHIYDPLMAVSRNRSMHKLTAKGAAVHPGKIVKFDAHFGREATDGTYKDTIVPVLQDGGEVYDVRASEVLGNTGAVLDERVMDAVDTYGEAKAIIAERTRDDYDWHSHVECLGLAGAYPGGIVDVRYKGAFDGFWYVRSVKHTINTSAFTSQLDISRNVGSPLRYTSTAPYNRPPLADWKNDRWEAVKKQVVVYA